MSPRDCLSRANLQDATHKGSFRADLYHRLDSIQLRVPSLRERADDILPLCELFLESSGCFLSGDAVELLQRYAWPGNVRELRNVLNKAVVFAEGAELTPRDLPAGLTSRGRPEPGYSLEKLEEETILRALEHSGGHQQKAADILGISRRTLIRKIKHYGPKKRPGATAHVNAHGRAGPGFTL